MKRAVAVLTAIGAFPYVASGANTSWTFNGSGNWTLASNWNNNVPVGSIDVFSRHNDATNRTINYDYGGPSIQLNSMTIENTATGSELFQQTANTFNSLTETIGDSGSGYWTLGGGTHNVTVSNNSIGLAFGSLTTGKGTGTMSGGVFNAAGAQIFVGYHGNGTFTQTNGTLTAFFMTMGWQADGVGTYTLNGGTANITAGLFVGYLGNGTMNMNGGTMSTPYEDLGTSQTSRFNQTAGTNIVGTGSTGRMFLGDSGVATYLLSGTGSLVMNGTEYIGNNGAGTMNQSGGAQTVGSAASNGTIELGYSSTGIGNYLLSAGSLMVTGAETVGDGGAGTFTQNGGTNTLGTPSTAGDLFLGVGTVATNSFGKGIYLLSGTGALTSNVAAIGYNGAGTFNQSGGTHSTTNLEIAANPGSTGTYLLSAGTLNSVAANYVGDSGDGTFNQMGGTNNIGTTSMQGVLLVGYAAGSNGTFLLSGGTVTVNGFDNIGSAGFGTFSQTGGAQTIGTPAAPGGLALGHAEYDLSGTGVLNVNGTVLVGSVANTLANFNQNGGTHNVGSSLASGTLHLQGFGHYFLYDGTLTVIGDEFLGGGTPSGGFFYQQGGTHVIDTPAHQGLLEINDGGVFSLNGGTLTVNGTELFGYTGPGSFYQAGGVHTLGSPSSSTYLDLGYYFPSNYSLSGAGSLNVFGVEYIGVVAPGTSTFTQTGGVNTVGSPSSPGYLEIGAYNSASTVGVYQLDDGSLNVNGFALVGGSLGVPGTTGILNIQGGSMSVSNTLLVWDNLSTAVNLTGGALSVGALDTNNNPSRFNWTAGTLTIAGGTFFTIGNTGPLGLSVTLNSLQTLRVNQTTSIASLGQITLNGGTFTTGGLIGSGHLIINSGTFQLTNSNIAIGPGAPLANTLQLNAGANIVVSGAGDGFVVPDGGLLQLNGGAVFVTGANGYFGNAGQTILSSPLSLISSLEVDNAGLLSGTGRINGPLFNQLPSGTVGVGANDTLIFQAAGNFNFNRFTLGGGTIQFTANLTNSGTISGAGSLFVGTLTNNGTISALTTISVGSFSNAGIVQLSGGQTNVFGPVSNTGRIIITGGSTTTFFGDVNTSTGSISVGTNSTAVFFGNVTGQSHFFGAGIKDFEGAVSGGPIASIVGDTYVGTPASVTTQFFNEDDLSISGIATVAPNGTSAAVSRVHTLSFFDNGKLDLNDNDLIIDYTGASPLATILSDIKTGYANGAWNGNQITSSSAHDTALTPHPTALGYTEASALGLGSFDGQSVDNTSLLIRYTFAGDANLDGKVNALDFNALASNFGGASGKFWNQGDFNYDGAVNTADFTALSQNFNLVLPSPPLGGLVPEPGELFLAAVCGGWALRRRSRW
jgi:hypothetical protein